MNAAVATVGPVVGTIGERIIKALRARNGMATLDDLKRDVDCNNPALIEMQLASMRKRGDVYIPKPGYFAFTASFTGASPQKAAPPPAHSPAIDPPSTQEPAAMATKECKDCHQEKDAAKDFYKGSNRCRKCYNQRQIAQRAQRAGKAPPKKKDVAAAPKQSASLTDELVIPATGAITCRMSGSTAEISQFEALICCTIDQLQILRDWATTQLRRAQA